jgi:hypothetical protein
MLIVAGKLYVHPLERDRWVAAHHEITRIARSQPGCLDLHLSADPLEEGGSTCSSSGNPKRHCRHGGRPQTRRPSPRSLTRASRSITSAAPSRHFDRAAASSLPEAGHARR